MDFSNHVIHTPKFFDIPFGAIDLAIIFKTPVIPINIGKGYASTGEYGSVSMNIFHLDRKGKMRYKSVIAHLSRYSNRVDVSADTWGTIWRNKFDLRSVFGYTGSSGTSKTHLHLGIQKGEPSELNEHGAC